MTAAATVSGVPTQAFESLVRLQQLSLEAGLSDNFQQLVFRILNRSICFCRYDRAVLWDLRGARPRLLGVSGNAQIDRRSPLVTQWRELVKTLTDHDRPALIEPDQTTTHLETWQTLTARTQGLSVVWVPIIMEGKRVAGLWLERWGNDRFSQQDADRLEALALAYAVAWRGLAGARTRWLHRLTSGKQAIVLTTIALLTAAMCLVYVPLRIVAHCEVVPRQPVAVTAPLDGVIDEVLVMPGRTVEKGELLAIYDQRVAREELNIARQQVQIIESDLQRTRVEAFDSPAARATIALLENRLAQERIRLQLAEYRVSRLEIRAPLAGTVMLDDPHEWRGRPVQVGQRLMMIVDPAQTKLRLWLPDSDNIDFEPDRPVKVVLDSDAGSSRPARLSFVASHAQLDNKGTPAFRAEADWLDPEALVKPGLQGTAVLYGQKVSLGYWLLRRPWAALRRYVGL